MKLKHYTIIIVIVLLEGCVFEQNVEVNNPKKLIEDYEKGNYYLEKGEYMKAIFVYDQVLARDNDFKGALLNRAKSWNNMIDSMEESNSFVRYNISTQSITMEAPLWEMEAEYGEPIAPHLYSISYYVVFSRNKSNYPSLGLSILKPRKGVDLFKKVKEIESQEGIQEIISKKEGVINSREARIFYTEYRELDQEKKWVEVRGVNAYILCEDNNILLVSAAASADEYPGLEDTFMHVINSIEC